MNNYHIYEEIGRGHGSIVYKGREKQTIKYVAIKSVDKSLKARVLNEVSVMYTLDHPNILKFLNWYETTNHIWLIVEYCTGGDLLRLLRQDKRLPEASVKMFARDILEGIHFVHHKGFIFGDLKPSNVLINEYGVLKLCDFGLSCAVPTAEGDKGSHRKGTPYYMSPELFQSDGIRGFASDFWAFGCVVYELLAGRPPFYSRSVQELVKSIVSEPYPDLPDGVEASDHLLDLIDFCLQKDPAQRITWKDMISHPFWGDELNITPLKMPNEPVWEKRFRPDKTNQFDKTVGQEKALQRTKETTVDIMRLSMNAAAHLRNAKKEHEEEEDDEGEMEVEVATENPSSKIPMIRNSKSNEAGLKASVRLSGDVALGNCDTELDFGEVRESDSDSKRQGNGVEGETDRGSSAEGDTVETENSQEIEELAKDAVEATLTFTSRNAAALAAASAIINKEQEDKRLHLSSMNKSRLSPHSIEQEREQYRRSVDETDKFDDGRDYADRVVSPDSIHPSSAQTSGQRRGFGSPESISPGAASRARQSCSSPGKEVSPSKPKTDNLVRSLMLKCMFHTSDTAVKPLVGNNKIEKIPEAKVKLDPQGNIKHLDFKPLKVEDLMKMAQDDLETYLTSVYMAIAGNSKVSNDQRLSALQYTQTIVVDTQVANMVINSSLMSLFVKMLMIFKSPHLKCSLLTVMSLLLRHATYIALELADTGIVNVLTDLLRDTSTKIRRRAVCALGELLFYVATQVQQDEDGESGYSAAESSPWNVPSTTLKLLQRCLRTGEDDVVRHYAAKTIENICAQCPRHASWFASQDTLFALLGILNNSKQQNIRVTCSSAMSLLLRRDVSLLPKFIEKVQNLAFTCPQMPALVLLHMHELCS